MSKKLFKKTEKCKVCQADISQTYERVDLCVNCAKKEIHTLAHRIKRSCIFGLIFVMVVFLSIFYARTTYFVSDLSKYKEAVFVPLFSDFYFTFNQKTFYSMLNMSTNKQVLLYALCFLIPFGKYFNLRNNTFRFAQEAKASQLDNRTSSIIVGSSHLLLEDIGLFIVSVLISALSGPFFFVYRPYKMWRLSTYVQNNAYTL